MLLTAREVAAILRISAPTVRSMCDLGTLRSVKVSARGLRIPKEAVDEYLRTLSGAQVGLSESDVPIVAAPAPVAAAAPVAAPAPAPAPAAPAPRGTAARGRAAARGGRHAARR